MTDEVKEPKIDMKNYNKEVEITKAVDEILTDRLNNPVPITGNERYAIWLYSKARRQYEWLNHYPTEQLARDAIAKHNLESSNLDLRLEEYFELEECWKCTLHIEIN